MTKQTLSPRPQQVPTSTGKVKMKRLQDQALIYDCRVHGKLEIGETLLLYADGTFEMVGKRGR